MNSEPMRDNGIAVATKARAASPRTTNLNRKTAFSTGRTSQEKLNTTRPTSTATRLTGFRSANEIRPRTQKPTSTGTSVTASSAAAAMA